jgi:uncharacterized membrane protein YbaN (DUF454 family)
MKKEYKIVIIFGMIFLIALSLYRAQLHGIITILITALMWFILLYILTKLPIEKDE